VDITWILNLETAIWPVAFAPNPEDLKKFVLNVQRTILKWYALLVRNNQIQFWWSKGNTVLTALQRIPERPWLWINPSQTILFWTWFSDQEVLSADFWQANSTYQSVRPFRLCPGELWQQFYGREIHPLHLL
jgi:hypothetical protein